MIMLVRDHEGRLLKSLISSLIINLNIKISCAKMQSNFVD